MKRYNPYKAAAVNMQRMVADDAIIDDVDTARKAAKSEAPPPAEGEGGEEIAPVAEPETETAPVEEPGDEPVKVDAVERMKRYFNPGRPKRTVTLDGKHTGQDGRAFGKREGKN